MTPLEIILLGLLLIVFALCIVSQGAAYRNGVTDGFGYSQEPTCPGYKKAGEYLNRTHRYRWTTALSRLYMQARGFDKQRPDTSNTEPPTTG